MPVNESSQASAVVEPVEWQGRGQAQLRELEVRAIGVARDEEWADESQLVIMAAGCLLRSCSPVPHRWSDIRIGVVSREFSDLDSRFGGGGINHVRDGRSGRTIAAA